MPLDPNSSSVTTCFCSTCSPGKLHESRTCRKHLEYDMLELSKIQSDTQIGAQTYIFLQECVQKTQQSLLARIDSAVKSALHSDEDIASKDLVSAEPIETEDPNLPSSPEKSAANNFDLDSDSEASESEIVIQGFQPLDDSDLSENELDEDPQPPTPLQLPGIFNTPPCVTSIQKELLKDHILPTKPDQPFQVKSLSTLQLLSLRHYIAWRQSNGTVRAFNEHREVLQDVADGEILSLHNVRDLALGIAQFHPKKIDMCPRSCVAYTGAYADLGNCPYTSTKSKTPCNEPRFRRSSSGNLIPCAQVTILPIMPSIQALFANAESSNLMRYRDRCLQEILKMLGENQTTKKRYSDFANGSVHEAHRRTMGLFESERDVALALSSDGAQLTMKKQSNTWISIVILLNLPPEIRYHARNIIINFATPGPNAPGDIESFLRPMFEELAVGSEGLWIWDALDSAWFFHRTYAVMVLGDMLGSAKVNGMSGHSAVHGDRFSTVQGARGSLQKGSKAQYYPFSPPDNTRNEYNPARPIYTPSTIPLRKQESYWETLMRLANAKTKADHVRISKETGVSKIPLAAASRAFVHPAFFPLDPFHLFYENCMPWFWDIWTVHSNSREIAWIPPKKVQQLGKLIADGMQTLPPSFCGAVRDPFLKRQSQYKAYEWMAILHWYLLPIALELEIDYSVLQNFSDFVYAVEFAMTVEARSEDDLAELQAIINSFLLQFERLYVGQDPERIARCRLCIFQLIHVPTHIKWFGSIRLGSQAPVERAIGEMGHKIHSKKEPFANLTNIIIELEVIRMLKLYYPTLAVGPRSQKNAQRMRLSQPLKLGKSPSTQAHLRAVQRLLGCSDSVMATYRIEIFGKFRMENGQTVRSRISEEYLTTGRMYRWFEAAKFPSNPDRDRDSPTFGEALAFYAIHDPHFPGTVDKSRTVVVLRPLTEVEKPFKTVIRGKWPANDSEIIAMETSRILDVVGIWEAKFNGTKHIYILRKHPSLLSLTPNQCGLVEEMDRVDAFEDDEGLYVQ